MLYLGMNEGFRHNHNIPNVRPFGETVAVELYGFTIPSESWVRWAAIDSDGLIYLFEVEPLLHHYLNGSGGWVQADKGRIRCAGECDLEGFNWWLTLVELHHASN